MERRDKCDLSGEIIPNCTFEETFLEDTINTLVFIV